MCVYVVCILCGNGYCDKSVATVYIVAVFSACTATQLQCVAVCCSVLQCVAVCCSAVQCVAACCIAEQC